MDGEDPEIAAPERILIGEGHGFAETHVIAGRALACPSPSKRAILDPLATKAVWASCRPKMLPLDRTVKTVSVPTMP